MGVQVTNIGLEVSVGLLVDSILLIGTIHLARASRASHTASIHALIVLSYHLLLIVTWPASHAGWTTSLVMAATLVGAMGCPV